MLNFGCKIGSRPQITLKGRTVLAGNSNSTFHEFMVTFNRLIIGILYDKNVWNTF